MKKQQQTWSELQAAKHADTLELLLDAMQMTADEHFKLIVETGCEFLKFQCGNDTEGYEMLKVEQFYWSWFVNQWNMRNEDFRAQNEETLIAEALFDYKAFGFWVNGSPEMAVEHLQAHYKEYHTRKCFYTEHMHTGYLSIVSSVVKREVTKHNRHLITIK